MSKKRLSSPEQCYCRRGSLWTASAQIPKSQRCVKYNYGDSCLNTSQGEDNSSRFHAAADSSLASKTNQRSRWCRSPELVAESAANSGSKISTSTKTGKPDPTGKRGEIFLLSNQHRVSDHNRRTDSLRWSPRHRLTPDFQRGGAGRDDDTCRPSGGITGPVTAAVHLEITAATHPQNALFPMFTFLGFHIQ